MNETVITNKFDRAITYIRSHCCSWQTFVGHGISCCVTVFKSCLINDASGADQQEKEKGRRRKRKEKDREKSFPGAESQRFNVTWYVS